MRAADFTSESPGRLVQTTPRGVLAFVPNPLPPALVPDHALNKAHSNARAAVRALEVAMPTSEFDPFYLAYPLMEREAYYSSLMEGTYTTPEDMALFELSARAAPEIGPRQQTMEVINYVRAMEQGQEKLKEGQPVSSHLIRGLHGRLLTGVRCEDKTPGEFRSQQNYIGRRVDGIENARFVPPPPHEVPLCMRQLDDFITTDIGLDAPLPVLA